MAESAKKDKRYDESVLGRHIGTMTGWDQADDFAILLLDFEPAVGVSIPAGDIVINFDTGKVETYNDDGDVTFEADIIDVLKDLPHAEAA